MNSSRVESASVMIVPRCLRIVACGRPGLNPLRWPA
jgi:hypothetical protein